MLTTALVAGIVLVASFIQGTAGFGFAFFSVPLLALLLDFRVAVPTLVLLAQVLNLIILSQHHFRADWKKSVLPLTLFSLPGIPVGVWLLTWLDVRLLQGSLGVILVFYALYQWLAKPAPRVLSRAWMVCAGFLAGCLGGALNSQGPPVLVYTSLQPWSKDLVKGTLTAFFFTTGLAVVATQAYQGLITPEVTHLAAVCLPFLLVGVLVGRALYKRLGEGGYRQLFMTLIFALGVMMIVKSIAAA
ncbi:MAG: sulfite exporter TauE/SafE family protein [Proteobacteria bacterium]|nr:sulfite exporter TauE/SafE family protein [Pseudomonadota bacterium]